MLLQRICKQSGKDVRFSSLKKHFANSSSTFFDRFCSIAQFYLVLIYHHHPGYQLLLL